MEGEGGEVEGAFGDILDVDERVVEAYIITV